MNRKRLLIILVGALGFVVAGCDKIKKETTNPAASGRDTTALDVLRGGAHAVLIGDLYDRAIIAARNGNNAALIAACDELRQLGAVQIAESAARDAAQRAVAQAIASDMVAQDLKGPAREQSRARAAIQYREALRLTPQFDSSNPLMLNGLGYFLAERGTTKNDFKEAERLTRRALQLQEQEIKQLRDGDPRVPSLEMSAANIRDSVAWALYRQGYYEEARREQEKAVAEARSAAAGGVGPISAELHFHLGEIYRVLKRWEAARQQYQEALRLDPTDTASQHALEQLPKASPKLPPMVPPKASPRHDPPRLAPPATELRAMSSGAPTL